MPEGQSRAFQAKPNGRTFSLENISRRVDALENRDAIDTVTMQSLQKTIAEFTRALNGLSAKIGGEDADQYGHPIGTGLTGRLMRLEIEVGRRGRIYEGLSKYAAGAVAATALLGVVIWWLLGDKLETLLK
jgi:hypothetical protein